VFVEFVGLPGAGKTHLSSLVYQRLLSLKDTAVLDCELHHNEAPSLKAVQRVLTKSAMASVATLRRPSLGWAVARVVLGSRQRRIFAGPGRLYLNWMYLARAVRRGVGQRSMLLLDQGFVQAFWSINLEAKTPVSKECALALFRKSLDGSEEPTLLVFVDKHVREVEARLRVRGRTSRRHRDLVGARLFEARQDLQSLVESFKAGTRGEQVYSLRVGDSGEETADEVAQEALRIFLLR
jgi:hypothetical protein